MNNQNVRSISQMADIYRPVYKKLYFMAYAITGNDRAAERALIRMMMTGRSEEMDVEIRKAALMIAREEQAEPNFDCLSGDADDASALADHIACFHEDARRALMLRYGLRLNSREICEAMHISAVRLKKLMEHTLNEAMRFVKGGNAEKSIQTLCIKEINGSDIAPDFNTILRAVENQMQNANANAPRQRRVSGAVNWLTAVATMLILAVLIWACAILLDYFRQTQAETRMTGNRVGYRIILEDTHACI